MAEKTIGASRVGLVSWVVFGVLMAIALTAWLQSYQWGLSGMSVLDIFPVLGLIAWLVMWSHYSLGTWRIMSDLPNDKLYSRVSGGIVLFAILLHPGLLAWYQWDKLSLVPPSSFYSYVGDAMMGFVVLGSISLMIFLSFEVFDRLRHKPLIKKNWFYISLLQMLAMTMIFVHGLGIGGTLEQITWFKLFWLACGAALIVCFGIIGRTDYLQSKAVAQRGNTDV